jgi:hypothetical protein
VSPEVILDLARIQRRVMGLPEPLVRLQQLEEVLCGVLTYEDRQRYTAEYLAIVAFPDDQRAA